MDITLEIKILHKEAGNIIENEKALEEMIWGKTENVCNIKNKTVFLEKSINFIFHYEIIPLINFKMIFFLIDNNFILNYFFQFLDNFNLERI